MKNECLWGVDVEFKILMRKVKSLLKQEVEERRRQGRQRRERNTNRPNNILVGHFA